MKRFESITLSRIHGYIYILLGHLAAIYLLVEQEWALLALSLVMTYTILLLGISLTYHRAIAHKSVILPLWLEVIGSFVGGLSLQGSPLSWAIVHRTHHKHTASEIDPHSPKFLGSGYLHLVGYAFSESKAKYGGNLFKTWHLTFHRYYHWIYVPIIVGSFFFMDFNTALAVFWAPIGLAFQFESFVNTWLHSWDKDEPVNNQMVQLFVGGEAYHKNHHDRPADVRFGKYDLVGYLAERYLK